LGKFLEALGSEIGTGLVFRHSFSFLINVYLLRREAASLKIPGNDVTFICFPGNNEEMIVKKGCHFFSI
jgi:hypothetical protein